MTMLFKEPAYIQMEIQIFSATSMEESFSKRDSSVGKGFHDTYCM